MAVSSPSSDPYAEIGVEETTADPYADIGAPDPYEGLGAPEPVNPAIAEGVAGAIAATSPAPEFLTKAMLTRGGVVGDIAAEVVPAIGGAIMGAPGGIPGVIAGGAAGAAMGNTLKQTREIIRGDRTDFGKGEFAVSTVLGGTPLGKIKPLATAAATVAKTAGVRGLVGGTLAGGAELTRQITDDDQVDLGRVGEVALVGFGFGSILGGGEGLAASRGLAKAKLPGAVKAVTEPPVLEPAPVAKPVPPNVANIKPGPNVPPGEGQTPLKLVTSAQNSPEIVPELKAGLAGYGDTITNAETIAAAKQNIAAAESLDAVKAKVLSNDKPDALSNATGLELIRQYQTNGRFQDAADVIYDMATKARQQGQAIQILSTLSRSTPEGMAAYAQRLLERPLTPQEFKDISAAMKKIDGTASPEVRLARTARLMDKIHSQAEPSGTAEKLTASMNIAMLLNPKTVIRNLGGNVIMAAANVASDAVVPIVDTGVSVFTGKSTVSGPKVLEYFKGLGQPVRDIKLGYQQARSEGASRMASIGEGLDTMAELGRLTSSGKTEVGDINRAYRSVFSSPVARSLERTLGTVLGSADRAFYTAAFRSSLANQVKASGAAVPTADMVNNAALDAAKAIYQDENFISKSLAKGKRALNLASTAGMTDKIGAGEAVLKFTQVPGALLMRGIEFSPAGFIKPLANALIPVFKKTAQFDQREFSTAFGKALAGSAGLVGAGYYLNRMGIVSGAPNQDPKVRELEKSMGFGEYKINVSALKRAIVSMDWTNPQQPQAGDVFINYDWAQPISFPVAMGADIASARQRNSQDTLRGKLKKAPGEILSGLMAGARTMEEQPMLTGLSAFAADVSDAARSGEGGIISALASSVARLPGQYVPTASRQLTQLLENRVYETRGSDAMENAYGQMAAGIPKLAEAMGYKPRYDMQGAEKERYQNKSNDWFNVLVNPAFVTRRQSDPALNELYRIWKDTGETGQIPGNVRAKITINGEPRQLNPRELSDYQQVVGRLARDGFQFVMRSDAYRALDDDKRAKVLADIVGASNRAARIKLFGDRPKNVDRWTALLTLKPTETTEPISAMGNGRR